jgi:hypothetical protein
MDKTHHVLVLLLVLTMLAALPRFYGLGWLGFYGDEETTAFPARAFAQGKGAKMPSGMPYRRALPFTWLNGLAAHYLGTERELAYRLTAAILGTLTIPLLFFVARPLVGGPVALVAAVLLAFSEWHIATSREARMYAPFLLFYLGAAFATWYWATTGRGRYLVLAALLFTASVSLHKLALIGIMFAVIPLGFAGWARVAPTKLVAAAVIAGIGAGAYDKYFVSPAYTSWFPTQTALSTANTLEASSWLPPALAFLPVWSLALVLLGAAVGLWAANRAEPVDDLPGSNLRSIGRFASAMLAGALACIGQLYGSVLAALVFLYLHPAERAALAKKIWLPSTIIILISTVFSGMAFAQFGLVRGLKMLVSFPFPYPALFAEMFPLVLLLFVAAMMYFALRPHQPEDYPLRACLLAVIFPVAAVGAVSRWGGVRYLFATYPFLLLAAAAAILAVLNGVSRFSPRWNPKWSLSLAVIIVASGLLGGHGIPQALNIVMLKHGDPVDPWIYTYAFYPDHKTPGEFVRHSLALDDIVIAEDPLQQRWYAGRADYWLRNPTDARRFTHKASDGQLRDIYVNSRLLQHENDLRLAVNEARGRVWIITSGENYGRRDSSLSPEQKRWLESVENTLHPAFIGQDKVTKVFCLNCTVGGLRRDTAVPPYNSAPK